MAGRPGRLEDVTGLTQYSCYSQSTRTDFTIRLRKRSTLKTLRFVLPLGGMLCLLTPCFAADSGKALYEDSCIQCHGPGGEGSRVMDDFWKMRIPRLNSAYVQSKTDAELQDIILNGKRKMPAAMAGRPETQHRTKITAQQVPALIAYLRTLKRK